jgi:hypothetical protein
MPRAISGTARAAASETRTTGASTSISCSARNARTSASENDSCVTAPLCARRFVTGERTDATPEVCIVGCARA